MFAMFSRILKLSGRYKGRIQGAFVCAFLESILSKIPIVLAFVVLSRFAADTLTSQTCLYIGLGLAAAVLVQMLVHYLSDSLQSAAGYLMFADKRMELGSHLRKLPMGYFTSGNIGKISSVLSTDMVFIFGRTVRGRCGPACSLRSLLMGVYGFSRGKCCCANRERPIGHSTSTAVTKRPGNFYDALVSMDDRRTDSKVHGHGQKNGQYSQV